MCAVSDSIKRSWNESLHSGSFGTMVRISKICKEDSFSHQVSYLVTLRKIFMAPRSKRWSNVFVMIR